MKKDFQLTENWSVSEEHDTLFFKFRGNVRATLDSVGNFRVSDCFADSKVVDIDKEE